MLFDFVDTGFSFTILFIIVGILFSKLPAKLYVKNCLAVSNHLLILYSWYLIHKFYQLIQFILSLNIPTDKVPNKPIEISWFQIKFLLLILLPYLFLFKKLARTFWLSMVMLVLLQWDFFVLLYNTLVQGEESSGVLFYMPYLIEFKILNYICLFVAVYALLWLLKRLPSQQVK